MTIELNKHAGATNTTIWLELIGKEALFVVGGGGLVALLWDMRTEGGLPLLWSAEKS
jgi:hypothetical protein